MIALAVLETIELNNDETDKLIAHFGEGAAQRLGRISSKEARARSASGLLSLKALTDRFLPVGADLSISYGELGKPRFENLTQGFNISHSGGLAAAALACDGEYPVGIDIEQIDLARDIRRISERFFLGKEAERISAAGYTPDAFYEIWTAKEACVKLYGASLSTALSELDTISLQESGKVSFTRSRLTHKDKEYILTVATPKPETIKITDLSVGIKIK